jgi:hypothetical protein
MSRPGAEDLPEGIVAIATEEKTLVLVVLLVVLSSSHRSFFVCFLEEVVVRILDVGAVCLQLWWVWLLWRVLDLA